MGRLLGISIALTVNSVAAMFASTAVHTSPATVSALLVVIALSSLIASGILMGISKRGRL